MSVAESQLKAHVGMPAPDFELPDGGGERWRLSQYLGRTVVLLFYPGDETMTCTKQMCSVRDRWQDYELTGAEVVAVSMDSVESHAKFSRRHNLPLRLLSDESGEVVDLYGVRSHVPGMKVARGVFVIDAQGVVRYRKIRPLVGLLLPPGDDEVIRAIRDAQEKH